MPEDISYGSGVKFVEGGKGASGRARGGGQRSVTVALMHVHLKLNDGAA